MKTREREKGARTIRFTVISSAVRMDISFRLNTLRKEKRWRARGPPFARRRSTGYDHEKSTLARVDPDICSRCDLSTEGEEGGGRGEDVGGSKRRAKSISASADNLSRSSSGGRLGARRALAGKETSCRARR